MNETGNEATGGTKGEQSGGNGLCGASAKDGRPCRAPVLKDGSGYCWMHSPATVEARQEAARRGGSSTSARRRLLLGRVDFSNSATILAFREALASSALTGQVAAARAGVALTAAKDAEGALFGQALEARLDVIEETLRELAREGADDDS